MWYHRDCLPRSATTRTSQQLILFATIELRFNVLSLALISASLLGFGGGGGVDRWQLAGRLLLQITPIWGVRHTAEQPCTVTSSSFPHLWRWNSPNVLTVLGIPDVLYKSCILCSWIGYARSNRYSTDISLTWANHVAPVHLFPSWAFGLPWRVGIW